MLRHRLVTPTTFTKMETSGNSTDSLFYSRHQLKVFAVDLPKAFVEAGFEVVEEPYIDYVLCGFRATYIRRYLLHKPTSLYDGMLTTIIHTAGIPFGYNGQKMVILSAPRNVKNEPVSETLKLRVHILEDGSPQVVHNESKNKSTRQQDKQDKQDKQNRQQQSDELPQRSANQDTAIVSEMACSKTRLEERLIRNQHEYMSAIIQRRKPFDNRDEDYTNSISDIQFLEDLSDYVSHIIEVISPGLIELPIDMKLEILKQLSVESIVKMSQVNNEFRLLIFKHGESLWRHLCLRDFNIRFINRLVHRSWMELYRDTYLIHQNDICRKERALPGLPERLALPPVPYRLQIEWLPEVLELPFYPMREVLALPDNPLLALEFHPLHRINSLDSLR